MFTIQWNEMGGWGQIDIDIGIGIDIDITWMDGAKQT